MTTPTPTEREKQAARELAREAYEAGHRFPVEVLNLFTRTFGEAIVRRRSERSEAA